MTVREFREAQKQARKDYFREAKVKYFYPNKGSNSPLNSSTVSQELINQAIGFGGNDGVMIYSPELQKIFNSKTDGTFTDAATAAHHLNSDPDFQSQGNRKEDKNRSEASVARNIFYAAWGNENREDKDIYGGQRNSAYSYIDKDGQKINLFWDFVDPDHDLQPELLARYNNQAQRLSSEEITRLRKVVSTQNADKRTQDPEVAEALAKTQDRDIRKAFTEMVEFWAESYEKVDSAFRNAVDVINLYAIEKFPLPIYCFSTVDKAKYDKNGITIPEEAFKTWLDETLASDQNHLNNVRAQLSTALNQSSKDFLQKYITRLTKKIKDSEKAQEYLTAVQELRAKGLLNTLDKRYTKYFTAQEA